MVKQNEMQTVQLKMKGCLGSLAEIEFLLIMEIWMDILIDIKTLSKYLQKESIDLFIASNTVKSTLKTLSEIKLTCTSISCLERSILMLKRKTLQGNLQHPQFVDRKSLQVNMYAITRPSIQ